MTRALAAILIAFSASNVYANNCSQLWESRTSQTFKNANAIRESINRAQPYSGNDRKNGSLSGQLIVNAGDAVLVMMSSPLPNTLERVPPHTFRIFLTKLIEEESPSFLSTGDRSRLVTRALESFADLEAKLMPPSRHDLIYSIHLRTEKSEDFDDLPDAPPTRLTSRTVELETSGTTGEPYLSISFVIEAAPFTLGVMTYTHPASTDKSQAH